MFKRFYGLRENPFRLNPDPRFLYVNNEVQEALAALVYGIRSRKGLLLLTGEVGTGKTTLINALLNYLRREKVNTAYVFNASNDPVEFLEFVLTDFDLTCSASSKPEMLSRFHNWLLELYRAGQNAVLIVDEAQNLSWDVLEEVRLLTNLETSTDKLLQIVLCGQPELHQKLVQPRLRQLAQRIAFWSRTAPLSDAQLRDYVRRRMAVAGSKDTKVFGEDALRAIHQHSRGIPRLVNLICEHALISGYVDSVSTIPGDLINRVANDLTLPIAAEGSMPGMAAAMGGKT